MKKKLEFIRFFNKIAILRKAIFLLAIITGFTNSGQTCQSWQQLGINIYGEGENDRFGESVSLSADGRTIAIGAHYNDGNGGNAGHVRIYQWNETTAAWQQLGIDIDGEAAGDASGYSVSLSADGNTVAIGAIFNDGNGVNTGHVRIYQWNGTSLTWQQQGADIDGESANDLSGRSVSLSADGSTVAIGASWNDGNNYDAGHVRIYQWNGTASAWQQKGIDIEGEYEYDLLGHSVSLSADGSTVAIGAPYDCYVHAPDNYGKIFSNAGYVRIYQWNGTSATWQQQGADIEGEASCDNSGHSVSLSADGSTVAIGAPSGNQVRVYQWNANASTWQQQGADIDGEAAGDYSGYSISLSADASTIAIGAIFNDGSSVNDAGHVRIYQWNGTSSAWQQQGTDIDGEAKYDRSGWSVSLSDDGMTVAIGAPFKIGGNHARGYVRVFELISLTTTNTFGSIWINPAYKAAGASDPQTYYWGLTNGIIKAKPTGGIGPYTYQWSSSEGYTIKNDTKQKARLLYPTGPQWVKVIITDLGSNCNIEDSVYIDWVDYTCNQPSIWYYELCNTVTGVTSCVQGTVNMRNLVSTGDYVYGPCGAPKTNLASSANAENIFEVELFPNPNGGNYIYTVSGMTEGEFTTELYDLNGRVLFTESFKSTSEITTHEVNLTGVAPGSYFMRVTVNNESVVQKVMIMR